MTLRVSASFRRVASSGREKGMERSLAPVHLSFYLKALHPAVETQLIQVPLPLNSLASANTFQREIKFSFRLKCKIEFGLSPKKAKLQAKLVKYFAHFKILEKQSLVPSQAPCPCTPSLIPPAPSTTSVHHRSWALTPWKLMLQWGWWIYGTKLHGA